MEYKRVLGVPRIPAGAVIAQVKKAAGGAGHGQVLSG